ncbi:MAG: phosphodiester glycosidase family protein [Erythrobacter sp.]|nr:phosphodiester glycosidase family protein [Erythrobacter sp.]
MKRALPLIAALALVSACKEQKAGEPVVVVNLNGEDALEMVPMAAGAEETLVEGPSACATSTFEEIEFTHCLADPQDHVISAVYGPTEGAPAFGTLGALAEVLDAKEIAFATNGGAFSDDLTPRGYLVTSGNRVSPLDQGSGDGNFYLEPNGVFFGSGGDWKILTTPEFLRTVRDRPQFGTQSGPMLLVGGELSEAINPNGNSRAVRNGVGIDADGKAHFVISGAPVSFGQLARFFRDELGATDALFLDANSSSLWDPVTGRLDEGRTGPILVVSKKAAP